MNSKIAFLLILSLWHIQSVDALQSLKGEAAVTHFIETMRSLTDNYVETMSKNDKGDVELSYSTPQDEHIINIGFKAMADSYEYAFTFAKKTDITKTIKEQYIADEVELQSGAFRELVKRMAVYEKDPKKRTIYFNTIEDVKQLIVSAAEANAGLDLVEEIVDKKVSLKLNSEGNVLALFTLEITSDNSKNYFIDIEFTVSNNNEEKSDKVQINMFEYDEKNFKLTMTRITSQLDVHLYINNMAIIDSQFKKFMEKNYKQIDIMTHVEALSTQTLRTYDLEFEKQKALVKIDYISPENKEDQKIAAYKITIEQGQNVSKELPFKRMTNDEFQKHLAQLELGNYFEDLWTKIRRLFRETINVTHKDVYPDKRFQDHISRGYIRSTRTYYRVLSNGANVMDLRYLEKSNNVWHLTVFFHNPAINEVRIKFQKDNFEQDIIVNFFKFALKSHVKVIKKPQPLADL